MDFVDYHVTCYGGKVKSVYGVFGFFEDAFRSASCILVSTQKSPFCGHSCWCLRVPISRALRSCLLSSRLRVSFVGEVYLLLWFQTPIFGWWCFFNAFVIGRSRFCTTSVDATLLLVFPSRFPSSNFHRSSHFLSWQGYCPSFPKPTSNSMQQLGTPMSAVHLWSSVVPCLWGLPFVWELSSIISFKLYRQLVHVFCSSPQVCF
jgi:hypothetical protein